MILQEVIDIYLCTLTRSQKALSPQFMLTLLFLMS
jgi:hypothetical protein